MMCLVNCHWTELSGRMVHRWWVRQDPGPGYDFDWYICIIVVVSDRFSEIAWLFGFRD